MKDGLQTIIATIAALLAFFCLGFLFQLPLLLAAVLALATFFGVYLVSKPQIKIGHINLDALPDGDALRALMEDAKEDMQAIEAATKQITHVQIKEQSVQLHRTGINILEYLQEHPDRISAARRFFSYYLETARNILEKYLKFQKTELRTEEVLSVNKATQRALPILNQAFEKQFTRLISNDIMDIEADIQLLETTLMSEGK